MTEPTEDGSGKHTLLIGAILIYDDEGNYFIHGSSDETPQQMFQKMQPLWNVNPAIESVRYLDLNLVVPTVDSIPKIRIAMQWP